MRLIRKIQIFGCAELLCGDTGASKDSSSPANYPTTYVQLHRQDLKVYDLSISSTAEVISDEISLDRSTSNFLFSLGTENQAGLSFQIVMSLNHPANAINANIVLDSWGIPHGQLNSVGKPFRIDPYKLVAGFGSQLFTPQFYPSIVKLDGDSSSTLDIEGLPSPIKVFLTDTHDQTIRHANCVNCAHVRLLQCADSKRSSYPVCAVASQAKCATSSADGTLCSDASKYLETLSGTTTTHFINGTAIFTDIQVQHVVGAGYKLEFVFNSKAQISATYSSLSVACQKCCLDAFTYWSGQACSFGCRFGNCGDGYGLPWWPWWSSRNLCSDCRSDIVPSSEFFPCGAVYNGGIKVYTGSCTTLQELSSQHGNGGHVGVPDNSYSISGKNSFVVLPHKLLILQNVGGDGVDANFDGVPDGVGVGQPFRVQPAVAVSGKGYYFSKDWNHHGYVSITAMIKTGSCKDDCINTSLKLHGTLTPVSPNASTSTAARNQHSVSVLSGSTINGEATQALYTTLTGVVSMLWKDLKITTTENQPLINVQLTFRVSADTNENAASTSIDSASFDVFSQPDAPLNLRIYSYDTLGFRIEFDPANISRARPLSGFLVEVELCTSASNESCSLMSDSSDDISAYNLKTSLGTDYSQGGGHTEEIFISYSNVSAGSASELSISFKPSLTISAGDSIVVDLGYPDIFFRQFNGACELTESSGHKLSLSVDSARSRLTFTVKEGYALWQENPVIATIPVTCNFILPGGTERPYIERYGTDEGVSTLPTIVIAAILGASSSKRFDNCKGNMQCSISSGAAFVLPSIQDSNSMDTSWSGNLQQGGIGTTCASTLEAAGGNFPSNRFCSFDTPNSNDPDLFDGSSGGNSGDNGNPIGSNPGRAGSSGFFYNGRKFTDSDENCRGGLTGVQNPCALTIGQDWTMMINIKYLSNSDVTAIEIRFERNRALHSGDSIRIPLSGLVLSMCNGVAIDNLCDLNISTIHVDYNPIESIGWRSEWHTTSKILQLNVGTNLLRGSKVFVKLIGFVADATLSLTSNIVSEVVRGSRTTMILKSTALKHSYTTTLGDPVGNYEEAGRMYFTAGQIYRFRVYAYNGRFLSTATNSMVHNRAITTPQTPAYITGISQATIGANLEYQNLAGKQMSKPTIGIAPPVLAKAGGTTRIGISFTPDHDLAESETVTIKLPGFRLTDYAVLNNDKGPILMADTYKIVGNSSDCACGIGAHPPYLAGGTVVTPRNLYFTTRTASGSGACHHSGNGSVPWCACGDGSCSLAGVPSSLSTHYNISGNCSGCACSMSGLPIKPATNYNVSGNCTSCECSAGGAASFVPFTAVGACANCACSGGGENAIAIVPGVSCSECACQAQSCSCACIPQACQCSCPVFRKCQILCPIKSQFSCDCIQNDSHPSITRASWSGLEESLVLTVGRDKVLLKHVTQALWISSEAGIKYPANGVVELAPNGISSGTEARMNRFALNWVSPFPTSSQPRLGFVVQFTSDFFWKRHIQTIFVTDILDRGTVQRVPITHLTSTLTAAGTNFSVGHSNLQALVDLVIQIDDEQMLVTGVTSTRLTVHRGYGGTNVVAHSPGTGGPSCLCHSNLTASGGAACSCTLVRVVFGGSTRPAGIDFGKTGFGGISCRAAANPEEGCNPLGFVFPGEIRTHQTAILGNSQEIVLSFPACGSGLLGACDVGCKCESSNTFAGMEFGNILNGEENVSIISTGDPFEYPLDYRTTLSDDVSASATALSIIVEVHFNLVGKYIRIDNEMLFVKSNYRGVRSVSMYASYPAGGSCTCTFAGVASTGCTCVGSSGVNCTSGGTLIGVGGGGSGFTATFTVAGGSINSITLVTPGVYSGSGPNVLISGGGEGCTDLTFHPSLSNSILGVQRAALGSTLAEHASGQKVYTILWPSQSVAQKPNKQYNFRIAAYNSAGLSNWLYHDLKLYNVFPSKISPRGNTPLEIILIGAGRTPANVTVYVGHTLKTSGQIDLGRSKKCTALMMLDASGTRLVVRSPPWVGKAHDLIVHYQSGIFEQFVVGTNRIGYESPMIMSVMPAMLEAQTTATLTIMGANFGNDATDVSAQLEGATIIPCTPFILVNDGQGICTLIPGKKDLLMGNLIVSAGSDFSGGVQKNSANTNNYIKELPLPVEVEVAMPLEISSIPEGSRAREAFMTSVVSDIAKSLGMPAWRITITFIKAGSVIVGFLILPDSSSSSAPSPAALAVKLAQQAADPNSALRNTAFGSTMKVMVSAAVAAILAAESVVSTSTSSQPSKKKVALNIDYSDPYRLERFEKRTSTANLH